MRHCSTRGYWPNVPGYRTPRARKIFAGALYEALREHLASLPLWLVWGDEVATRKRLHGRVPDLVTVTRCDRRGYLTTVQHLANEPYPRP